MALSKIGTSGISDSISIDTDTLVVDGVNNQVGVGTASPNANLHTAGSSTNIVSMQVQNTEGTGSRLDMYAFGSSPAIQSAHRAAVYQWTGSGIDLWSRTGDLHFGTSNTESMRIDSSGRVTMPYQPSFHAHSPAVTSTGQVVIFGGTFHNIGSHYNTSNGSFTCPIAGIYIFTFSVLMGNPYTATYHRLVFRKNGTISYSYGDALADKGGKTSHDNAVITVIMNCAANDYIDVFNNGTIPTYGTQYGQFSGALLG